MNSPKNNHIHSPILSVIMPTYNRAHLVSHALESILAQTHKDFEFLIIDDGSTDNTDEVIKRYANQDRRIISLRQEHKGASIARNYGSQKARGKYLCFQDDDDSSAPQRLEKQLLFSRRHPSIAACVCLRSYTEQDKKSSWVQKIESTIAFRDKTAMKSVPWPQMVLNPTTMIKREIFDACNGYRSFFICANDYDFTLRFQEKFQVGLVAEPLYDSPPTRQGDTLTTRNYMKVMNMHIAAHISAWYRRNNRKDPIRENKSLIEVMSLLTNMPANMRIHLVEYIRRCIINIRLSPNRDEWTYKNIKELYALIRKVRPGIEKSTFKGIRNDLLRLYWKVFWFKLVTFAPKDT